MGYTYQDSYIELHSNPNQSQEWAGKIRAILDSWSTTTETTINYKLLHPITLPELMELENLAGHITNTFKQVVIVGIGGSALNPKMITSLKKENTKCIEVKYLDTTDPIYYTQMMNSINLRDTYFLVISKSGKTVEILSILGAILQEFANQNISEFSKNFCFITGKEDSHVRRIATSINALILEHDDKIGGRFSTFTNVGILPGLLAGLDMRAFIEGANLVIKDFWAQKEHSAPALAAKSLLLFQKPMMINIAYLRAFSCYLDWYSQIISESLGKDGKGITPITNLGPMDQHSMFQLYLEGPTDKIYTFIHIRSGSNVDNTIKPIAELEEVKVAGKTLNEVNNIEFYATMNCFKEEKFPVRQVILNELNESSLGALAMHSILEVITLGHLMQINPFDQPSVEKIKNKVSTLLYK